ncbi:hypothetical protein OGAPHI_005053 [Ogataea philodendri]|uniref:Uncharacterized protein n=1 Tax=Ogataea philodendri TaxID=1378263 RepID=A0A9P8P1W7_9ASCO|nr:uncharacterized protein OGAPHI_005053 [Ogataea philodendri]KAH3663652.1 hypothetical protein OGAPHI_005053 [Ogataea philodendri]
MDIIDLYSNQEDGGTSGRSRWYRFLSFLGFHPHRSRKPYLSFKDIVTPYPLRRITVYSSYHDFKSQTIRESKYSRIIQLSDRRSTLRRSRVPEMGSRGSWDHQETIGSYGSSIHIEEAVPVRALSSDAVRPLMSVSSMTGLIPSVEQRSQEQPVARDPNSGSDSSPFVSAKSKISKESPASDNRSTYGASSSVMFHENVESEDDTAEVIKLYESIEPEPDRIILQDREPEPDRIALQEPIETTSLHSLPERIILKESVSLPQTPKPKSTFQGPATVPATPKTGHHRTPSTGQPVSSFATPKLNESSECFIDFEDDIEEEKLVPKDLGEKLIEPLRRLSASKKSRTSPMSSQPGSKRASTIFNTISSPMMKSSSTEWSERSGLRSPYRSQSEQLPVSPIKNRTKSEDLNFVPERPPRRPKAASISLTSPSLIEQHEPKHDYHYI